MIIELKNFRCYKYRKIVLPDSGLNLISGESGKGKTTILKAILYALYGKVRKPYTFGAKSCAVKLNLESFDIEILRTSSPNRLIVNYDGETYEDSAAQGVINNVLGMTHDEFKASSYVIQGKNSSILSLPSAEQIEFINKLTFAADDSIDYKNKIKIEVRKAQDELVKVTTRLELLTEGTAGTPSDTLGNEEVVDEIDLSEYEIIESRLHEYAERSKKALASIEKYTERANKLQSGTENKMKYEVTIKSIDDELSTLALGDSEQNLVERMAKLNCELKECQKYSNLLSMKQMYEDAKKEHFAQIKKELKKMKIVDTTSLQKNVQVSATALKDLEGKHHRNNFYKERINKKKTDRILKQVAEIYGSPSSTSSISECITLLQSTLVAKKRELALELADGTQVECPHCSKSSYICSGRLERDFVESGDSTITVSILQSAIDELENWLSTLQENLSYMDKIEELPNLETAQKKHSSLCKQLDSAKNSNAEREKLESILKNRVIPDSIANLSVTLGEKPKRTEQLISHELSKCQVAIAQQERRDSLLKRKAKLEGKIEDMGGENIDNQVQSFRNKIAQNRNLLKQLVEAEPRDREIFEQMKAYKEYLDRNEVQRKRVTDIQEAETLKTSLTNRERALKRLLDLSRQAEVFAIDSVIQSINSHARVYLDQMFEDPMEVRLENTGKAKMTTTINYNGKEYTSIDELSGGERQRVNLAYILGVNDMLGSGILFLDECLNNLDSQTNMEVIQFIRDVFIGDDTTKLVFTISHEAIKGIFDSTINL